MPQPSIHRLTVIDLVPFGPAGPHSGFYALRLSLPEWEEWRPGQFIMLRPENTAPDTLWGRPFSICLVTRRDLVIFFQIAGRATAHMAKLTTGDAVDVWGPLGNALAMEPDTPTLLLAGGIGIAPFVGYVNTHPTPWEVSMEFGHRMPLNCYPFDSMNEHIPVEPHMEREPADRKRFIALLDERIAEYAASGLVLACGPTAFLKTVQELAAEHKARAQLCLETRMACGVGACLGCVVKSTLPAGNDARVRPGGAFAHTHSGSHDGRAHNVQTCTCGPNFWSDTVLL